MISTELGLVLAAFAATTSAAATFDPISNGPSYAVSIPSSTVSAGSGDIYFQLSAPVSYQWVGLGIGGQMAGASIFVMYEDGNGNVTISPRNGGQGHVEPLSDSALQVELLEGSGIVDGRMIANVLCTTCTLDSTTTSTSSPWIAAWLQGSPIDSTSVSATINQHDLDSYRQFTFDLTQAVISTNSNPFISTTASATGSSPTSTTTSSNTGSGSTVISQNVIFDYEKAHGIIMATTVVLLFPIGAIFMRVGGSVWGHGLLQIFNLCALLCGFGIGIKLAQMQYVLFNTTHTLCGTCIVCLFILQPFLGLWHHRIYQRTHAKGIFGYIHQWYGRILILLGIINGGLGLKLAANTRTGEIIYGAVAGGMAIVYVAVVGVTDVRRRRMKGKESVGGGRGMDMRQT